MEVSILESGEFGLNPIEIALEDKIVAKQFVLECCPLSLLLFVAPEKCLFLLFDIYPHIEKDVRPNSVILENNISALKRELKVRDVRYAKGDELSICNTVRGHSFFRLLVSTEKVKKIISYFSKIELVLPVASVTKEAWGVKILESGGVMVTATSRSALAWKGPESIARSQAVDSECPSKDWVLGMTDDISSEPYSERMVAAAVLLQRMEFEPIPEVPKSIEYILKEKSAFLDPMRQSELDELYVARAKIVNRLQSPLFLMAALRALPLLRILASRSHVSENCEIAIKALEQYIHAMKLRYPLMDSL